MLGLLTVVTIDSIPRLLQILLGRLGNVRPQLCLTHCLSGFSDSYKSLHSQAYQTHSDIRIQESPRYRDSRLNISRRECQRMSAMTRCPHCSVELSQYRNFAICMNCGWSVTKPVKIRKLTHTD